MKPFALFSEVFRHGVELFKLAEDLEFYTFEKEYHSRSSYLTEGFARLLPALT